MSDELSLPLARPFPSPGPLVVRAYHDLWLTESGTQREKAALGSPANLPHPWDPPTCTDRRLRWELWQWLDAVAAWINHEYLWEPNATPLIPDCWPQHPHIIHELAVVADMRHRSNLTATSDNLEIWHRVVLPGFLDRMQQRLRTACEDHHQPWPARGRYTRHINTSILAARDAVFDADVTTLTDVTSPDSYQESPTPLLSLVRDDSGDLLDPDTGQLF